MDKEISGLNALTSYIASDFNCIQAGGGNISLKSADNIYVKASGFKFNDVKNKNIFSKLPLSELNKKIKDNIFSIPYEYSIGPKPSMETMLHALCKTQYVVHIHHLHSLSYLIRQNCKEKINSLPLSFDYKILDYYRPGEHLAKNLANNLFPDKRNCVYFLMNHGVIFCADSKSEFLDLFKSFNNVFIGELLKEDKQIHVSRSMTLTKETLNIGSKVFYRVSFDDIYISKAISKLINLAKKNWALYPDHIVYLGTRMLDLDEDDDLNLFEIENHDIPFIFKNGMVYAYSSVNKSQTDMLISFFYLLYLSSEHKLSSLTDDEANFLSTWDLEIHRKNIS